MVEASLAAGLYEELVFRAMLIGLPLAVFGLAEGRSSAVVPLRAGLVIVSSIAFAWTHVSRDLTDRDVMPLTFILLAGGFLGMIYLVRGFGVAVVTHAVYDAVAFSLASEGVGTG